MNYASVEDRVENGIDLLNRISPKDWIDRIDVDELDVGNFYQCPLSLVFGGYSEGYHALSIHPNDAWMYGFEFKPDVDDPNDDYTALTNEWYRRLS